MLRLPNKTALITGGGGTIGSAMAELFAAEGAKVIVAEIDESTGRDTADRIGPNAEFHRVDISSNHETARMFDHVRERYGGLDILVNNAIALDGDTTIEDLEEPAFDRTIAVCLKGPYLCTRYAIPLLTARGGGSIVTISSINALFGFGHTAYTAAKGGLISMMRLVAAEYGDRNIRSNIICPGTIETPTSMRAWESKPDSFRRLKEMYPVGRIGTPMEVANYALFLASDESSFVTGSVQVIDGGILAGRKFDF